MRTNERSRAFYVNSLHLQGSPPPLMRSGTRPNILGVCDCDYTLVLGKASEPQGLASPCFSTALFGHRRSAFALFPNKDQPRLLLWYGMCWKLLNAGPRTRRWYPTHHRYSSKKRTKFGTMSLFWGTQCEPRCMKTAGRRYIPASLCDCEAGTNLSSIAHTWREGSFAWSCSCVNG